VKEERVKVGFQGAASGAEFTPWSRTSAGVAERKEKSRAALEQGGGRQLRDVRLDREANEAFDGLKVANPTLDNGGIVRLALVQAARTLVKDEQS